MRYIVVTGGVVSGLGKGITISRWVPKHWLSMHLLLGVKVQHH